MLSDPTASVTIRAATHADIASIESIERTAFADPWSGRSFEGILENGSAYFGVACDSVGQAIRGYVVAWFVIDECEVANLAVRPGDWGRGIGGRLLDAALAAAQEKGSVAVYLEMRDSNVRARQLYGSRGFEEMARRRDYYQRPTEDAVVWRKLLGAEVK